MAQNATQLSTVEHIVAILPVEKQLLGLLRCRHARKAGAAARNLGHDGASYADGRGR